MLQGPFNSKTVKNVATQEAILSPLPQHPSTFESEKPPGGAQIAGSFSTAFLCQLGLVSLACEVYHWSSPAPT